MTDLYTFLKGHAEEYHPVLKFNPAKEKIIAIDLSGQNLDLRQVDIKDTNSFNTYISGLLKKAKAKFGIGGYNEDRQIYLRSELFNSTIIGESIKQEVRSIHLGIDVWGEAGTKIFTPLGGIVHSIAYNDKFGDYGATLIMTHQLQTIRFHFLYGHLSQQSISSLQPGVFLSRGEQLATIGQPHENGNWPPHLHFQIIDDIGAWTGDYPGVCSLADREKYLINSPDPDCILGLNAFISS